LQLPPPDSILSNVYKDFEECNPIKRFQNKHNSKHIQNKVLKQNLKAFTLAEVLIALVIIGIIAAITVPTLIQKYQEEALKSALKKNYSVLKSALDKYQVDNGERLLSTDLNNMQLKSILMKYLNVMTDCGWGALNYGNIDKVCIPNYGNQTTNSKVYKNYIGTQPINLNLFDEGQFVLNDGSLILIQDSSAEYKYISVDVNGYAKKPNRLGKDLFMFQLMENGELLPMGAKGTYFYRATDAYCSNTSTSYTNGAACTYKALQK
jgi:prepilin-type N-terminal cleavage/methylation domain-containing protein